MSDVLHHDPADSRVLQAIEIAVGRLPSARSEVRALVSDALRQCNAIVSEKNDMTVVRFRSDTLPSLEVQRDLGHRIAKLRSGERAALFAALNEDPVGKTALAILDQAILSVDPRALRAYWLEQVRSYVSQPLSIILECLTLEWKFGLAEDGKSIDFGIPFFYTKPVARQALRHAAAITDAELQYFESRKPLRRFALQLRAFRENDLPLVTYDPEGSIRFLLLLLGLDPEDAAWLTSVLSACNTKVEWDKNDNAKFRVHLPREISREQALALEESILDLCNERGQRILPILNQSEMGQSFMRLVLRLAEELDATYKETVIDSMAESPDADGIDHQLNMAEQSNDETPLGHLSTEDRRKDPLSSSYVPVPRAPQPVPLISRRRRKRGNPVKQVNIQQVSVRPVSSAPEVSDSELRAVRQYLEEKLGKRPFIQELETLLRAHGIAIRNGTKHRYKIRSSPIVPRDNGQCEMAWVMRSLAQSSSIHTLYQRLLQRGLVQREDADCQASPHSASG